MEQFKDGLAHKAFKSYASRGRLNSTKDDDFMYCNVLDPFELDVQKILESKAIRRLKDKTQVFCFPENPHVRTRLSHTFQVVSVATAIARILGLNVHLCQAIAWGHDIGHAPYGHMGEEFIAQKTGHDFRHEIFGVVIAQRIERQGKGLNLSFETLQGIANHSRGGGGLTVNPELPLEDAVVMYADKIAYTFSDIKDGLRNGHMQENHLPPHLYKLGNQPREWVAHCIFSLAKESCEKGVISFSDSEAAKIFAEIKSWMYENVYADINWNIQRETLSIAYDFFKYEPRFADYDPALPIALMTDREANRMTGIIQSSIKPKVRHVEDFGFMEILPHLVWPRREYITAGMEWKKP